MRNSLIRRLIRFIRRAEHISESDFPFDDLRAASDEIKTLADGNRRLTEERGRMEAILENTREGVILIDSGREVLLINGSARAFMLCGNGVIGRDITRVTRDYNFLQTADAVISGVKSNAAIDLVSGGKSLEAEFTALDGGVIVTLTDVTASRGTLKLRRDFFANASHELKTPITSIKGSAELLTSGLELDDAQKSELLRRISLETDRMYSLINDIIMISRIESGEVAGENEDVDLAHIVRECRGEAMPLAEQNGVKINAALEPVTLYASQKNLYEMVSNLVVNAVKYNRPGGRVDISLTRAGGAAVLTVRNDGDPIPPEHQRRVFERFYRVDRGRSKTAGGTGLGLAIVKHVVDSMGGTIKLESTRETGTVFTVTLPVK